MEIIGVIVFCIAFILITVGLVCTGVSCDYMQRVKGKGIVRKYLINALKLSQVKEGKPDPWGRYPSMVVTKGEALGFKITGIVWILFPIVAIIGAIMLLKFLFCSLIGWIILASIVGIVWLVRKIGRGCAKALRYLGSLSEKESKVSKVVKGMIRLANED